MTRDVGYAAPGRLWFRHAEDKERKRVRKRAQRETRERTTLSRKKHKSAKNGKRGKREKKTAKEQTERKSLLLCFFFVRESCSFSRLSSLRSLTRSSKKNRHFRTVGGKKKSTKHSQSRRFFLQQARRRMIQMRRIGLGWLPGASIGVLSGFFIFNEPLREFHAVKEKKNTLKSTEKKNENNSRSEE